VLALSAGYTFAADTLQAKERVQTQKQEQIYGSQLMTSQERTEYHARIRSAKTVEAREKIRNEHHEQMQKRAQERGVTLPEQPPVRGSGMRSGSGIGPGSGMGAGRGR
jgi:hypothetical protein